jgi:Zn-dependent metalloprotease
MKASACYRRILLIPVFFLFVTAAVLIGCRPSEKTPSTTFDTIAEPIVSPGWITFKDSAKVDPNTLFKEYADLFRLPPGNEMVLNRIERDEEGLALFRYVQFYKGIEVEHAEFRVHARGTRALSANGELEFDFQPAATQPAISEEKARQALRAHIPDTRFFREDRLAVDVRTTPPAGAPPYFPKGSLLYTEHPETAERVLAWMFRAYTFPLAKSRQVYIDAVTGQVIKEQIMLPECFAGGGNTTFRGFQNFNTARADIPDFGERFILMDDCHGCRLHLLNWNTFGDTREIFDADNSWNEPNNLAFVTSYWALGIAYDYFDLVHGRKSWDNKNSDMTIINDGSIGNNANGGGGVINIGLGPTNQATDDYNTTDIVGHEFTHSVIETSARLGYDAAKESAALNESFSDIFGQMIERWEELNANPDWVIGDAKGCGGGLLCRDLKNPKTYNHPDTYKGKFWQTMNIDPHVNGTVQNRWFVLLADGGSGTNSELGTQYNLTGIGIVKARRIAYRTLTRYLTAGSDYADARDGSIQAARDFYGPNSLEVGEVIKAWCAVGLCTYSVPKLADIFDRPGGNPNPASPNNNNSYGGATPLGTGGYAWTADAKPQLTTPQLSIFPLNDADYFRIYFPQVKLLDGRCFAPGVSFRFGTEVNARVILDGKIFKTFRNVAYFSMALPETQNRDFVLEVTAAFPGQILDYKLAMSFFQRFISDCYQTVPPNRWELIRNCPMCDLSILSEINQVILEPFYRQKDGVAVGDYFFYKKGEGAFEIPINIREGNALRVELMDDSGKVVAAAVREGNAATLRLRSAAAKEGVYSLRFSGYGNGTEIEVRTPMVR